MTTVDHIVLCIALSVQRVPVIAPTCGSCKPYRHIMAALRTMAMGLALS